VRRSSIQFGGFEPSFTYLLTYSSAAGADEGLGDGVCGRGRLLSSQPRDRVGGQRRERSPLLKLTHHGAAPGRERAPLDPLARADHAAQRARVVQSVWCVCLCVWGVVTARLRA